MRKWNFSSSGLIPSKDERVRFSKYITQNWPPLLDDYLIRSPISDKMSNYFSQYLQHLIFRYTKLHDNLFPLQEVECSNHRHKLDYLIAKGNAEKYFKGQYPKDIRWVALIESQWGNNNSKKKEDYINRDFPKLLEWESKYRDQVKIALLDMSGHKGDWKQNHQNMAKQLQKTATKDSGSRYLVLITSRIIKDKALGYSVYDKWQTRTEKLLEYL